MIDINHCCKKLGVSVKIQEYFNNNKHSLEYVNYYGFALSQLPEQVYLEEPLLNDINSEYKISGCSIIKLDPFRCYKWHQDAQRGVSINLLLSPESRSTVLFGNSVLDSEDQFEIAEFQYEANYFYLFNTQAMHTVINYEQPRYLFSLEFEQDKHSLTFSNFVYE
jgi:hypothetical protein